VKLHSEHLVIHAPNWLGDAVMAQPAMRAFVLGMRAKRVSMVGRAWLADVLPYMELPGASFSRSIPEHADMCIMFPNSFRSAWMAWRSGCPRRIGFRGQWRRALLTDAPKPRIDLLTQRHREYYLDLAEQCGMPIGLREVQLNPPAGEAERGERLLAEHKLDPALTIAIAPGAQFGGAKRYPAERWARATAILSERGYHMLALGTQAERDIADLALVDCAGPCANTAGHTSLADCLRLLCASRALLCNDSGLMHMAAGLGKPVVTVFGATDPQRTAPSGPHIRLLYHPAACSPCLQRECTVADQPCMVNVAPDEVADACVELLT